MAVKATDTITLYHVIDVTSTTSYYLLQSSTLNPPAKPTTDTPGSGWTTTEPSYTEGSTNTLYTVIKTKYSDDSFEYTPVSKSSSYEAAKEAYNKALAAQDTANTTQTNLNNLQIGGRNYALDTLSSKTITGNNENNQTVFLYYMSLTKDQINTIPSNKFKFSLDITISKDITTSDAYISIRQYSSPWSDNHSITESTAGTYHKEYVWTQRNWTDNRIGIRLNYIPTDVNITISNLKVEIGDKYTDWTPAPEDTLNELIELGGRNFIKNSNGFTDDISEWSKNGTVSMTAETDNTFGTCFRLRDTATGNNERVLQTMHNVWKKDKTYTISGYIKASTDGATIRFSNALNKFAVDNIIATTEWTKFVTTIVPVSTNNDSLSISIMTANVDIYLTNLKLELGNKATDWTPAPEDTDTKLNNIEIGGRNFISDTSKEVTITGTKDFVLTKYAKEIIKANTKLTISFDAKTDTSTKYMDFYWRTSDTSYASSSYFYPDFTLSNEYQHFTYTGISGKDLLTENILYLRLRKNNTPHGSTDTNNTIYIKNLKLESGDKATDWTPAPEDTEFKTTEIIVGTQTAATNAWTGVASFDSLKDGQQIAYWLPYDGTSSNATLNLTLSNGTTTGAKACYYQGTSRITTHYKAGSVVHLTYKVNANVNGTNYTGWWGDANYDSGNNTNLLRFQQPIKAASAITAGQLIVATSAGYKPIVANTTFDLDKPILVASSNLDANATGNNNYLVRPDVSIRTTLNNSSWTATQYETLYLVGIINGNTFTVHSTPFTTTKPTSDDGKYYISLGYMYSTYQIILYPEHPIFKYVNGQFKNISQIAYEAQNDFNTMEIGGRNLINHNNTARVRTSDEWQNITLPQYGTTITYDQNFYGLKVGDTYTLRIKFKDIPSERHARIRVQFYNSSSQRTSIYGNLVTGPDEVYSYLTSTLTEAQRAYARMDIIIDGNAETPIVSSGDIIQYKELKLEKGNKPTDWTLAPEDMDEKFDNLEDQINDVNKSVSEVIVGTQTAATNAWTGVASFDSLVDKQQVTYWLPYDGTSSSATLNLTLSNGTTTGAIPCYYGGTSRITTHYKAGNAVHLTYRTNVTVGTTTISQGWWADANYNTNDNTYDRIKFNNNIKAKTDIAASTFIVGDSSGYTKLITGVTFDLDKPILWARTAIAANATGSDNYLSMPSCTMRNNTSSSWTATQGATLYLVGTMNGNKFTVDSMVPFTTVQPTSDNGKYYISLGYMYSTYQIYLYPEHPIFKYFNGFKQISQIAYEAQVEINNTEIGGRNYLSGYVSRNGASAPSLKYFQNATYEEDSTVPSGYRLSLELNSITSNAWMYIGGIRDKISSLGIQDGDELIFSFYAKTDSTTNTHKADSSCECMTPNTKVWMSNPVLNTTWQRVCFKIIYSASTQYQAWYVLSSKKYNTMAIGEHIYLSSFKIEKGTKPTDWSLSLEDTKKDIDDAKNVANSAAGSAESAAAAAASAAETASAAQSLANDLDRWKVDFMAEDRSI